MIPEIKVSIVEDLEEIRLGVVDLLRESEDFVNVSAYSNAEEAVEELPVLQPDIVLMDIHLPGMTGVEAIRKLTAACPHTQFIMFTIYENNESIFDALKAGANGYLLKNTPPDKMLEALKELFHGGAPMSPQIARKLVTSFKTDPFETAPVIKLSKKDKEVIDGLSKGFLYKEIADQLNVNTSAVRQRIHKIYTKLHVQNRTEALNKLYKK